jgi:hypothetical protein
MIRIISPFPLLTVHPPGDFDILNPKQMAQQEVSAIDLVFFNVNL